MVDRKQANTSARADLVVVQRRIGEIRPDPTNARRHTRRQVRQIAKSIETFGFSVPILVNSEGQVIAGHGRLAACQLLGWSEVPTICLAHLSPEQARALAIADNRLNEMSTWDDQLLAKTLLELSETDLNFSIEATGFDMGEIDWRISGLDDGTEDQDDAADQVPDHQRVAVSRTGDLWALGRHRLICGSALQPEIMTALTEGSRVRMVFTDPPYNVPIQGHVSGLGVHRHREFAMASGEMSQVEFADFLAKAVAIVATALVDGGLAFTCMDWRHVADLIGAVAKAGGEVKNICVWAKHNPGMGSLYRSGHELVVVSKHGSAPHVNNVELGRHGRHRSNVWRYPGANSPKARKGKEGDLLALHPTPKPVALVSDVILDCSDRGDVILDPFLGSGTTLIAAERTGRLCQGIELDPIYIDTTIRRFEAFTGTQAIHLPSGCTFTEYATQRGAGQGSEP